MKHDAPSSSFALLDRRVQHWIWEHDWKELRDIQERAIPAILVHEKDVILSSGTASGKTEAAFLPIITHMVRRSEGIGLTVYISPLIALINDQFERLLEMCEEPEVPVHAWHGGIAASRKRKFLSNPAGILLITPESLQAFFCTHGGVASRVFAETQYIVIDEIHSFIGTERGKQLQTLMHLIECAVERKIPRIGLSATLGDMQLAGEYLRKAGPVEIIESNTQMNLQLLMKGYEQMQKADGDEDVAAMRIAKYLFPILIRSNNLIFPNSRANVEYYTKLFSGLCEVQQCPNAFFAHHGNLSHAIREEAEITIKRADHPTSIVCTNTLELGIDIGSVESIVQIGSPPSVSSLRQRLGRSGRKAGTASILRAFTIEPELSRASTLGSQLRERTVEFCAIVNLLLRKWNEPPRSRTLNLSTLVQQILSLIAQHGGVTATDAYRILCSTGPFDSVARNDFMELLRSLHDHDLITQDRTGVLFHGTKGERLVNHYSFYAAFESEKEFRIVTESKTLGTLPINSMVAVGDYILFAGKAWVVSDIAMESRVIHVSPQSSGKPPAFFSSGGRIHGEVRKEMRRIYEGLDTVPYADETTMRLIEEGRQAYHRYHLDREAIIQEGGSVFLFSWLGDDVNEALSAIFRWKGFSIYHAGVAVILQSTTKEAVLDCIHGMQNQHLPSTQTLLERAENLEKEKWDWALSRSLLEKTYESSYMDGETAWQWLTQRERILIGCETDR